MCVVQGDFDYPRNQKLLYDYHDAFQRVARITKREDGTVPTFWLEIFRQWLHGLQRSFDADVAAGTITAASWMHNASDDGVLAYVLLSQTGDTDNPVDKSKVRDMFFFVFFLCVCVCVCCLLYTSDAADDC